MVWRRKRRGRGLKLKFSEWALRCFHSYRINFFGFLKHRMKSVDVVTDFIILNLFFSMANKIPPLQDMYYLDINIYKNIKYQMKMNISKIDISGMPLNFVLLKEHFDNFWHSNQPSFTNFRCVIQWHKIHEWYIAL